jgi:hypothetical protein
MAVKEDHEFIINAVDPGKDTLCGSHAMGLWMEVLTTRVMNELMKINDGQAIIY